MMPMGGYYKLNRAELKAEMEILEIPNQKRVLQQIKWLEEGATQEFNKQREKANG